MPKSWQECQKAGKNAKKLVRMSKSCRKYKKVDIFVNLLVFYAKIIK